MSLITVPQIGVTPSISINPEGEEIKQRMLVCAKGVVVVSTDHSRDIAIQCAGAIKAHLATVEKERVAIKEPFLTAGRLTRELDLLTQMVAERVEEHVKTLFGLLALLHPSRDVWAAHRSLVSGRRELRAHALEYLDNTLQGEVRRNVFAVIDDVPLTDKLHAATRQFGVRALTRAGAVSRYLGAEDEEGADGPSLTVAALYSVYTERMEELYPRVHALHEETPNGLVRETAKWVASRIAPGPPGQAGSGR